MTALLISELSGFPKAALQAAETLNYGAAYRIGNLWRTRSADRPAGREEREGLVWPWLPAVRKTPLPEAQDALEQAHSLDSGNAMYARCLAVCYFSHAGRGWRRLRCCGRRCRSAGDQQLLYEIGYVMTRLGVAPQRKSI
jgi:hypothetical protein